MRVKVGDDWFESEVGAPIMIELGAQDKVNIKNMLPSATKYAIFVDEDLLTREQKLDWMAG